ncbi:MAG: diguanylate cyclase [Erysipelotrichaceae bacterium]
MDIAQTVFDLLLTCALFLGLFNASSLIYKQKNGRMFTLFLLNSCLFIIAFGYLMEQNASSLQAMINWDTVKLAGLMFFPACWGFAMLGLSRRTQKYNVLFGLLMGALSITFISLRLSDATYGLFYVSVKQSAGILKWALTSVKGQAYIFFLAYLVGGAFLAFMGYMGAAVRYIGKLRNLYLRMAFIALIPLLGLIAEIVNPLKTGLDFMSLFVMVAILTLSFAILRSDFGSVETKAKALLFKQNEDPLILTDEAGRLLDFNIAADLLFPELDHTATGRPLQDILVNGKPLFQRVDHPMKPDFEVKRDKGSTFYEIKSTPVGNAWGRSVGRLIRLSDVTRKRDESDAMHRLATRDSLTGLLNRRQFLSLAKLAFERNAIDASGLALILFDLDRFKAINEKFGPAAGDEVLRIVGNLLVNHFRKSDLVGRIGGEEFAVLLPSTSAGDAAKLAERCCAKLREAEIVFAELAIKATLSGGVAATPGEEADLDTILKAADRALRESKEKGRDQVSVSKKSATF